MSMSLKKTRIKNAGQPVKRKFVGEDGLVVTEEACPLLHTKMVDPAGFVVNVALGNGGAMVSLNENPYAALVTQSKLAAGFLRYYDCPKNLCKVDGPAVIRPDKFVDTQCCEHMLEVIMRRRAAHTAEQAKLAKTFNQADEKWIKLAVEAARQEMAPPARPKRFVPE